VAEPGGRPGEGGITVETDIKTEPVVEEDEPARINGRRVARWITILALGILLVLAIWQEPVHAFLP
jgi:hypothetical protein